jgi:hypothetical protein
MASFEGSGFDITKSVDFGKPVFFLLPKTVETVSFVGKGGGGAVLHVLFVNASFRRYSDFLVTVRKVAKWCGLFFANFCT